MIFDTFAGIVERNLPVPKSPQRYPFVLQPVPAKQPQARPFAVRGCGARQKIRFRQQPSLLLSASPENVFSAYLLAFICEHCLCVLLPFSFSGSSSL
jgi:hypothetical protein